MVHAVFWLSIISFTLLFAGLGAEFLAWLRRRERWRAFFVWYILIYTVFSLLQTFTFFNFEYLREPIPGLDMAFGYLRLAISVLLIIPAALTAIVIAWMLAGGPAAVASVLNIAYNSTIAIASLLASLRVAAGTSEASRLKSQRSEILWNLRLSAAVFGFLALFGLSTAAGLVQNARPLAAVGVNALLCLAWGLLLVLTALKRAKPYKLRAAAGHPRFIALFPFSSREGEVIELLLNGLQNKEIAQRLFISIRTVETHIHNIYRKCGCRNKVELVNLAREHDEAGTG